MPNINRKQSAPEPEPSKSASVSNADFWANIPQSKYKNLSAYIDQELSIYAVTEFNGNYGECYVLHAIPVDLFVEGDENPMVEILVSKGAEGRDAVCELLKETLGETVGENHIELRVVRIGRFNALKPPTDDVQF